jgi:hypothetical protein
VIRRCSFPGFSCRRLALLSIYVGTINHGKEQKARTRAFFNVKSNLTPTAVMDTLTPMTVAREAPGCGVRSLALSRVQAATGSYGAVAYQSGLVTPDG